MTVNLSCMVCLADADIPSGISRSISPMNSSPGISTPSSISDRLIHFGIPIFTLAEYKEHIKTNLEDKKADEAKRAKEDAAVDKAIENAQMDIPELMTKTECRQMMDDFSRRMQQQGLSMEQYFQFTGQSMDKMMEDMKPQALKRIQTRLVLEKIAEVENIQPTEEEVNEEISKMAEMYKMEADKLKDLIGENEMEQMKKDMAVQKAVTLVADAAVEA